MTEYDYARIMLIPLGHILLFSLVVWPLCRVVKRFMPESVAKDFLFRVRWR